MKLKIFESDGDEVGLSSEREMGEWVWRRWWWWEGRRKWGWWWWWSEKVRRELSESDCEERVMSYDDEDKYEWYLINKWMDKSDLMRRDKGGEVDIFHKVGSVIRRR